APTLPNVRTAPTGCRSKQVSTTFSETRFRMAMSGFRGWPLPAEDFLSRTCRWCAFVRLHGRYKSKYRFGIPRLLFRTHISQPTVRANWEWRSRLEVAASIQAAL